MALSDDLHKRTTRATFLDWRTDLQWDEHLAQVRDAHVAGPLSRVRGRPAELREATREATGHWWVWLVAGIAWIAASLIIVQLDAASVTTVGVVVGLMFALTAVENFALTAIPGEMRWISAAFGALFVAAEVVCFVNPADTFAALAGMLGFLFGLIGVWWMIEAFLERPLNPLWWMGLLAGILMTGLAFWTTGHPFVHNAYELLVCAGCWALLQGITHIGRAFAIRRLDDDAREPVA